MAQLDRQRLILRFLIPAVLIGGLVVFSYGISRTFQQSSDETLTPKQREHSKHFKEYKQTDKLPDMVDRFPDGVRVGVGTSLGGSDPTAPPFDLSHFLKAHACQADAVIVGKVVDQSSHMTEDQNFVFTDNEMMVEDVLKDNSQASIAQNTKITVARAGGLVKIHGRIAEARDESFRPLQVGRRYLLFLKYIPESGGYKSADSQGSFLLSGQDQVTSLTGEYLGIATNTLTATTLRLGMQSVVAEKCPATTEERK